MLFPKGLKLRFQMHNNTSALVSRQAQKGAKSSPSDWTMLCQAEALCFTFGVYVGKVGFNKSLGCSTQVFIKFSWR